MPRENPVAEAIDWFHHDHEWIRHGRHAAPETPAPQPVNLTAAAAAAEPQEEPMSLLDTIKRDVADVEAKLASVDEDALAKLNTVLANPETADVLSDLAGLGAIVGIPEGTIAGIAGGLKTLLGLYPPAPAQPDAPQQPAVPAGQ